jgi:hypothetical protein
MEKLNIAQKTTYARRTFKYAHFYRCDENAPFKIALYYGTLSVKGAIFNKTTKFNSAHIRKDKQVL